MTDISTTTGTPAPLRVNPPPHPNPSRPAYRLPPGACDAHCHVFGPGARFAYSPKRTYEPTDAPAAQLRALHALLGIERVVLVQASIHGHDNSAMLDAIAQSPDTYRGVAMVPASIADAELRALHEGGVRSLRFNFVRRLGGAPDLDAIRSLAHRVKTLGWHLVLHFDPQDLPVYRQFLDELPLPYVIDHMGRVLAESGPRQERRGAYLAPAVLGTGPAFRGRRALRAPADPGGPRPRALGHRLAAPQRARDARRRQAGRPAAAFFRRSRRAPQAAGGQPHAPLLARLKRHESHA